MKEPNLYQMVRDIWERSCPQFKSGGLLPHLSYRALVRLTNRDTYQGNDALPATVTPCEDGRLYVKWDHGVRPGHFWDSKSLPQYFEIKPLTEPQNPVKPKEAAQKTIPDWIREAAIDVADYFPHEADDTGRRHPEVEAIIRKHASVWGDRQNQVIQEQLETIKGLQGSSDDWKDRHDRMQELCAEKDATIAMLSQQLQDKRDIIRKLTA